MLFRINDFALRSWVSVGFEGCFGEGFGGVWVLFLLVNEIRPLRKLFNMIGFRAFQAALTSSGDHFFLHFLGSIRVLKPQNRSFSALSEPPVRFRINGLRFGNYLTRKRSLVRIQSCLPFNYFIINSLY